MYIIDEVHMLSPGAFNALLKTLEEPPKHVKFILATTEPQKLPATILSRCQRFDFKKISEENISLNLSKICKECEIEYSDRALNLIAELSEGAMRDALSILERCSQGEENNITEEKVKELVGIPKLEYISGIFKAITEYNVDLGIEIVNKIILEGKDIDNFLWEVVKYARDIMILKTTNNLSNIYSENDKSTMSKIAEILNKDRIFGIIYSLSDLENEIKWSSQKNIIFQVGIMRLCSKENSTLNERVENLERKIASGGVETVKTKVEVAKVQNKTVQSTKSVETVERPKQLKPVAGEEFWTNVINKLKEERKAMLYSNLNNTKAILLDDMTVGIKFLNGLNSFGKAVIEKTENMNELKKLVSMECGKEMRIKLILDSPNGKTEENNSVPMDLGIDINYID